MALSIYIMCDQLLKVQFWCFLTHFNLAALYLLNKKSFFLILNSKKLITFKYCYIVIQLIVWPSLERVDKICRLLREIFFIYQIITCWAWEFSLEGRFGYLLSLRELFNYLVSWWRMKIIGDLEISKWWVIWQYD